MNLVSNGVNLANFGISALNNLTQPIQQMFSSFGGTGSSAFDTGIVQQEALMEKQMMMNLQFQQLNTESNMEKSRHESQMSVINNLRVR